MDIAATERPVPPTLLSTSGRISTGSGKPKPRTIRDSISSLALIGPPQMTATEVASIPGFSGENQFVPVYSHPSFHAGIALVISLTDFV
jgi:hypothetical protein